MQRGWHDSDEDTWFENLSSSDQTGCFLVSLIGFVLYLIFFVLKPMYWDEPEPPPEERRTRNPYSRPADFPYKSFERSHEEGGQQ